MVTVATLWASALVFIGLTLALGAGETMPLAFQPMPLAVRVVLGLTAVAAGLLVFMCLVADRLFPRASRRVVWWGEIAMCVVLFAGLAWLGFRLVLSPAG